MALKKPSDLFGNKSEDNNIPVIESDSSFREELIKVESLSEQVNQLQQELSQKVIKNDLESLVLSQINTMQENFEFLQNDFRKSNKKDIVEFKERVSELTEIVGNLVENELPKYKKQVTKNEVSISNQFTDFKEEIGERIEKFYEVLNEFNDVVQVIDTVSNIENYIQEHHQDLVHLREEVFYEIEKLPFGNLQENLERLEKKIDFIKETYSKIEPEIIVREVIREGLLNNPPDTKNSDPLTPLDQKFVTLDQLQEHYRLFINRIQQQLSTLGGGGETQLRYLDDIVGIATNPSVYDGKFLKYNHSIGKFIFDTGGSGGGESYWASTSAGINTLSNVGIGTTNPQTKLEIDGVLKFTGSGNIKIGDIGTGAGITSGISNNFLGYQAGNSNTTGAYNNFLGYSAGSANTTGSDNIFIGQYVANINTTGSKNNFFCLFAGGNNRTGSNNTFLGSFTGISTSASRKIILGSGSNFGDHFDSPDTTKDTQFAVGVKTDTNPSKYWLVGNENFNVGIGTTNPTSKLEVQSGDIRVGVNTSQGLILTSPNGTKFRLIVDNSGVLSTVLVP